MPAWQNGTHRPAPAGREDAIGQAGEAGFVRWLAARDGVQLARLEPDPRDEAAYLLQRSSALRDLNMYNKRSAAALAGKRVFAVAGRDHVAHQADAPACALGDHPHRHD